jgi:hypothetical protein
MEMCIDYFKWKLKEKVNYWDEVFETEVYKYEGKKLLVFIKKVIMDSTEKVYCKRRALQELLTMVYKGKIKPRKIIGLLLDEWDEEQEDSLECLRLRYLSLFFQNEPEDIKSELIEKTKDKRYEIKSEANYQLGLIKLFEANDLLSEEDYKNTITVAEKLFQTAGVNDDNRIDAELLKLICRYLVNSISFRSQSADELYKQIMSLIWETRLYSFNECTSPVYIGISRSISKLQMIKCCSPEFWLDYRKEFNNLCLQFYELKNVEYKENPFYEKVISNISDNLVKSVVEPIFKYNYKATISKIDVLLYKDDVSIEEKEFLGYLKQVIINENISSRDTGFSLIREMYPMLTEEDIENFSKRIHDSNKHAAVYELLKSIKRYSYGWLLNSIIMACVKLQGNHIYRTASEDDRNGYIKDLLQTVGFSTKDQTRWGVSNTGKSAGEVDILIEHNNYPYSVIEALNLTSLDSSYLNLHINKIFKYDTTGLLNNFIICYVTAKDFATFWEKYMKHIKEHKYQYELDAVDDSIDNEFAYAEIKVALTKHKRDGKIIGLYHICVKIPD